MIVKNQHYVPRELLRSFSCDEEKKSINMFYLKENVIKEKVRLYNQACETFFYGKDQRLEKAYAIVEGNFASALDKLKNGNTNLSQEENAAVKMFMVFQWNRTPEAVNKANDFLTQFLKEIVKNSSTFDQKVKTYVDYFKMELTQPHDFLFEKSLDIVFMVNDLKLSLIENKNETFIIGQSPVYVLNPLLYAMNYKYGFSGLGEKGAIVLMPISPQYTVILYDSFPYVFTKKNGIIVPSVKDVNIFNYCQFLKTIDCIYYKNGNLENFKRLNAKSKEFRNGKKAHSRTIDVPKGEKGYIIMNSYNDFPFPQEIDCIKIKECAFMTKMDPFFDVERPAVREIRLRKDKNHEWINERMKKNNKLVN